MPGVILAHVTRTFGTDASSSIYDLQMVIAPGMAGKIADRLDDVTLTFVPGCVVMILGHWVCRRAAAPAA